MILPQNGLGSCQSESKLLCYFGAFRNYRLQYSYSCSYNHSAKTDHHWDVGRGMLPKTFAFFRQWCSATRKFCAVPSTISNQDHQQFEDLPQTRLIFQLSVWEMWGRGNKHDEQEQATALPQLWIEWYWQYITISHLCLISTIIIYNITNVSHNQLPTSATMSFLDVVSAGRYATLHWGATQLVSGKALRRDTSTENKRTPPAQKGSFALRKSMKWATLPPPQEGRTTLLHLIALHTPWA